MDFVHLHVHTHYSLLDGLAKPKNLVKKAVKDNMPGLAITDHGVMYGVVDFYKTCKEAGIKPIIGCEFYLARNGHQNKRPRIDTKPFHLVLLAKNMEGYRNLLKLTSIAHMDGFYYKPRIDFELLQKYSNGLIASSACIQGEVPKSAIVGGKDAVVETIKKYQNVFGKEDFYLEIQHNPTIEKQKYINDIIIEVGQDMKVPIIATNDVHYVNKEDNTAQDILVCIQTNKQINDENRLTMLNEDFSLKSPQEMYDVFSHVPESLSNTLKIMEKCNVELEFGKNYIPHFPIPDKMTENDYLRKICFEGLEKRYGLTVDNIFEIEKCDITVEDEKKLPMSKEDIVKRLDYELGVVENMGFPGYFLIVWDFIKYAKDNGIFVGPGRGSAAGALLSYSIGITEIDPLEYGLLFERFLNPDRISMPDIDIDFEDTRREEVYKYVQEKYGTDKVCQSVTFGTMAARAAVKDVGRVYGESFATMNLLAGKIPSKPGIKLADALKDEPELVSEYKHNTEHKKILDEALKLEGTIRQVGVHACAVIISKEELTNFVPLQHAPGDNSITISQYSMKPLEDIGLLKMDFLGLRNLSIMRRALAIIKDQKNIDIDINNLNLEDPHVFKLFASGRTIGVFQFESTGMRKYLKELQPTVFEDLIAMVALYRPGPMQFIDTFISRKHGMEAISYEHKKMEEALKNTYGVTVYQEQIMKLSVDMASFTGGQADTLRKAIGKKKADLMAKMKDLFVEGCEKNNINVGIANAVWKTWEAFAQYCFNRSHAACYALIAYQTAYLKTYYPSEFMAALMTADQDNSDRLSIDLEECKHMGIKVLAPDINQSLKNFTVVEDNNIRFGFKAIKNCGVGVIENIIKERKENGIFKDLSDFVDRIEEKVLNRKGLDSLIKSGALDQFEERGKLLENMESILHHAKVVQKQKKSGQVSLFGKSDDKHGNFLLHLVDTKPLEDKQKLAWEKEYLGFYLSGHPFEKYYGKLKDMVVPVKELKNKFQGMDVVVGGVVRSVKKFTTKKGDLMMFVTMEDLTDSVELVIFPKPYKKIAYVFVEDNIVLVKGKLSDKDGNYNILVNKANILNDEDFDIIKNKYKDSNSMPEYYNSNNNYNQNNSEEVQEQIEQDARNSSILEEDNIIFKIKYPVSPTLSDQLKDFLLQNNDKGETLVYLEIFSSTGSKKIQTNYRVLVDDNFLDNIADIVGKDNIVYN